MLDIVNIIPTPSKGTGYSVTAEPFWFACVDESSLLSAQLWSRIAIYHSKTEMQDPDRTSIHLFNVIAYGYSQAFSAVVTVHL